MNTAIQATRKTQILEKLELAREIGLTGYVQSLQQELDKNEIMSSTSLKFKPTTRKEVNSKLPKWCLTMSSDNDSKGSVFGGSFAVSCIACLIFGGLIPMIIEIKNKPLANHFSVWSLIVIGCLFIAFTFWYNFVQKLRINSSGIGENGSWKEALPKGAMLAIKEAKEIGMGNFEIHYPIKDGIRINLDPIITAIYKGVMFEVFHWKDGIIRDKE